MNEADLRNKGWIKNPDGSMSKPNRRALGRLQDSQPEPDSQKALDGRASKQRGGKTSLVWRVKLISFRSRILDRDNFIGGCKGLRDIIADSLGIDDNERFISWEYEQLQTQGREGTLVVIEKI